MTRLKRQISAALEAKGFGPLDDYVAEARRADVSWRGLAESVTRDAGEDCSHANLVNWYDAEGKPRAFSPRSKQPTEGQA